MPQTRFTKEFQDEAVRLALTSGRSRRAIAEDLGVGLSTLRNWIDRRRERQIDDPPADRQEDMVAELKRLRRENEILRQEREILKRATAFFAKEGSRCGSNSSMRRKRASPSPVCARSWVSARAATSPGARVQPALVLLRFCGERFG